MRRVTSREYKLMLDHLRVIDRKTAAAFLGEVKELVAPISVKGRFDSDETRTIEFLDTEDFTLRRNGLVLRRREERQFTLKCRTPDRYIADGIDLSGVNGLRGKDKFEEDIGLPFVSRFSHSNTVAYKKVPSKLAEAASIFPFLANLRLDGRPCSPKTELRTVNNLRVAEQVFTGPTFALDGTLAEVALILWSNGSRPLLAEFSFRYKAKKEAFSPTVAALAKRLFELLQLLDWSKPGALTKTEYVYRSSGSAIA